MKKTIRSVYYTGFKVPNRIFFLLTLIFLLSSASLLATPPVKVNRMNVKEAISLTIKGQVVDDADQPIPGVSVKLKNTSEGTVTDVNGNYTLTVPDNGAVLVFTFTGYESQEVSVGNKTNVNVKLKASNNSLDEVVVVGYGVLKKSSVTGAVTKINNAALNTMPSSNAVSALQGKIPGLVVGAETTPGSTPSILLRGNRSITAGNGPLYVVDGVPLSGGTSISDIAVTDIESIEVLKDAASAAIYGSRGANGVIMVTTRRGRPNQPIAVSFDSFAGVNMPQIPKLSTGEQYIQLRRDAARINQIGGWDKGVPADNTIFFPGELKTIASGNYVDWQKLLFRNGINQSYSVNISHGSDKSQVYFSLNYVDQQGYYRTSVNKRINGVLNADYTISKFVKAGVSTRISNQESFGANQNGSLPLIYMNPLAQPFDDNGNLINLPAEKNANIWNPLANYYQPYKDITNNLRVNNVLYLNLTPLKGLTIRSNFSLNVSRTPNDVFRGKFSYDQGGRTSYGEQSSSNTNDMVWDNIITYIKDIGAHNINFTGVTSFQTSTNTSAFASGEGFPIEDISSWNLNAATQNIVIRSGYTKTAIESYLGRLHYSYQDKYHLEGTFRADGSSVLAAGNQWAYFPGASGRWVISKEKFFKVKAIDQLSLRASYGVVGNSAIGAYSTIAQAAQRAYNFGDNVYYGYRLGGLTNSQLKWEYSSTLNLGVDATLLNGRINATLEVYRTQTKDLLLSRSLPTLSGFNSVLQNVGRTSNRGVELTINTRTIQGTNFKWNTDLNLFANKERIDQLITDTDLPGNGWFIGQPVQVFYDYRKIGIWQTSEATEAAKYQRVPGDVKRQDINGDGVVDAVNDRVILGQTQPKFNAFLRNSFDYKGFNFSFALEGKFGRMVRSEALGLDPFYDGQRQMPAAIVGKYWTPDNPSNEYPRVGVSQPLDYGLSGYRKGGYINMQEMTFGYNFKKSAFYKAIQVYVRARNPFYVWREDTNIDPQAPGFNVSAFRTYVLGFNVRF